MNNLTPIVKGMAGLAAGLLIGAGAALLAAPHSGQVTRSILLNKGIEVKGNLEDELDHWRWQMNHSIKQLTTDARRRGVHIEREAREAIEQQLENMRLSIQNAPPLVHTAAVAHHESE